MHRLTITRGSPADGSRLQAITDVANDVWVSFVVRGGQLLTVSGDTRLRAGDEVLVLADPDQRDELVTVFQHRRQPSSV